MTYRKGWGYVLCGGVLIGWLALAAGAAGAEVPTGQRAVAPAAPVLPAEIVAALQETRYDAAVEALAKIASDPKTKDEDRAYLALVKGIAERLAGKSDVARATLQGAIK